MTKNSIIDVFQFKYNLFSDNRTDVIEVLESEYVEVDIEPVQSTYQNVASNRHYLVPNRQSNVHVVEAQIEHIPRFMTSPSQQPSLALPVRTAPMPPPVLPVPFPTETPSAAIASMESESVPAVSLAASSVLTGIAAPRASLPQELIESRPEPIEQHPEAIPEAEENEDQFFYADLPIEMPEVGEANEAEGFIFNKFSQFLQNKPKNRYYTQKVSVGTKAGSFGYKFHF